MEYLIFASEKGWEDIDPKISEALVASMNTRIRSVMENQGDNINA